MPSFDVVSEIDHHELKNALDHANREIGTRYDFKGSNAKIEQAGNELTIEYSVVSPGFIKRISFRHQCQSRNGVEGHCGQEKRGWPPR